MFVNKIKNIKITKKNQELIILAAIFISMLILNFLTPLIADDYSYALNLDNEKISSIKDIIEFQIKHYLGWGGRSIAHSIAQLFLIFPKYIFNIFNSIIYVIFIYLIYMHIMTSKEKKPIFLILIHFALYFLLPVFGQNCIWLIGSCNYLWTTTIILTFLLFYKNKDAKMNNSKLKTVGLFLLGVIAGWTNENTAVGLIAITIILTIINKNGKISKCRISGIVGLIIGFIIMIAAPGNYVRNTSFNDNTFILIKWLKRFITCTNGLVDYTLILIIIIVLLISYYIYKKEKISKNVFAYIIGGLLVDYAMILSPEFPERSWFGVIVFMIIAIGLLLYNVDSINSVFTYIIYDIVIIVSLVFIVDYISLAKDTYQLKSVWNNRISTINSEKVAEKDFEFYTYYSQNKKSPAYGLSDIGTDSSAWPNLAIEYYYKINSIKVKEK